METDMRDCGGTFNTPGQKVTVQLPGRTPRTGTVAHIHTAPGYVSVLDDRNRSVSTHPVRFVSAKAPELGHTETKEHTMKLEEEYERINQQFLAVKRDNERMREDNARLRIQVTAYLDSDASQKREIQGLNEEAARLASQLAAQVAANAELREAVAKSDDVVVELEREIDGLRAEVQLDGELITAMKNKCDALAGELTNVRVSRSFYASKVKAQQDEIERLKSETRKATLREAAEG